MALRVTRRLANLLDVDTSGATAGDALVLDVDNTTWVPGSAGGGGGPPSGAAGGALGGTYPNPSFAVDMATQTELETAVGGVAWTQVTKGGDESLSSSTTVQNDDHLSFTAASGALYEIELGIVWANGSNFPGLKVALGEDGTVRGVIALVGVGPGGAAQITSVVTNQSDTKTFGGTVTTNRLITATGNHAGAGGTFRLLWAQNVSDPSATIVRAGSVLRYRRIL